MTEPKEADYIDFECDTFLKWDSPNLPKEVIENTFQRMHVDELKLVEDLIQHYGNLEKVILEDFPKSLKPLIEHCIAEYKFK